MNNVNRIMIIAAILASTIPARGEITVASGFEVETLARPVTTAIPRLEAVRNGDYGSDGCFAVLLQSEKLGMFFVDESGLTELETTAGFPEGSGVLDLRFDTSRVLRNRLFCTVAIPESAGNPLVATEVRGVNPDGSTVLLKTIGESRNPVLAYMDMTDDAAGFLPGMYLYDSNITGGTSLFHIDGDGTLTPLGANVLPPGRTDVDIKGMEFDPNGGFSSYLTIADADDNDDLCGVLLMRPDLAMGPASGAVPLSSREYTDMAFSSGGDFKELLYVTDRVEQYIYVVDDNGIHEVFAKGFEQIESITVNDAGTKMYVSDANGIHRIQREIPPVPETFSPCNAVSAGVSASGPVSATLINVGQPVIGASIDTDVAAYAGAISCLSTRLAAPLAGDCNADRIINLLDYECFLGCLSGPGGGVSTGCGRYDFDDDVDVDNVDWSVLQTLFDVVVP